MINEYESLLHFIYSSSSNLSVQHRESKSDIGQVIGPVTVINVGNSVNSTKTDSITVISPSPGLTIHTEKSRPVTALMTSNEKSTSTRDIELAVSGHLGHESTNRVSDRTSQSAHSSDRTGESIRSVERIVDSGNNGNLVSCNNSMISSAGISTSSSSKMVTKSVACFFERLRNH